MHPHPDIQAELATLDSVLAGYPRRMPFAVPQGYFEASASGAVERVLAAEAGADPVLPGATRMMPFTVPDGYFDALPDALLEASLQAFLPKHAPRYSVPAGYFNALPDSLLAAAKAADAPRVLPMPVQPRRTIALPALRWAAAAALVLGIGVGLYRAGNPAAVPATTQRALAAVPKQALQEYVLQNIDDFDTELLSEAGVNATPATPLNRADVQAYLSDNADLL